MSRRTSILDDLFDALEDDFRHEEDKVSDDELDRQRSAPDGSSVPDVRLQSGNTLQVRNPTVRPHNDSRAAKKLADQEQQRQWEISQTAKRTGAGNEAIAVVYSHGFHVVDRSVAGMCLRYYGQKRFDVHTQVMKHMLARCAEGVASGVQALCDTLPKRVAPHL